MATITVVLEGDPFTKSALNLVRDIRAAVADLGLGVTALVGGGSATLRLRSGDRERPEADRADRAW